MLNRLKWISVTILITGVFATSVWATPTRLVVRALAHDAKFIGSVVGGMKITVKDYFTGEMLASGIIMGGTGNTKIIMKEPVTRGKIRSKGRGTASAEFVLDIHDPQKLLIEVTGPLAGEINIHKEVKTTWLIPGKDIAGDGIVFEPYGLIVHPHNPEAHEFFKLGANLAISAVVTPMCGCPVKPDFKLWDANNYHVTAYIYKGSKKLAALPLKYAGKTSNFASNFTPKETGNYRIVITAYDDKNNQGVGISGFVVIK